MSMDEDIPDADFSWMVTSNTSNPQELFRIKYLYMFMHTYVMNV